MRIFIPIFLIVLAFGVETAFAGSPSLEERLDGGEVVIKVREVAGSPMPHLKAVGVIDAPPKTVWYLVEDCNRWKRNLTRIERAETVWRRGEDVRCKVTVDMPFPVDDLTAVTDAKHREKNGTFQRKWHLVEGDYRRNKGSWTITSFKGNPDRALVVYEVHAEPRMAVPDFIVKAAQSQSIPKLYAKLRKRAREVRGSERGEAGP